MAKKELLNPVNPWDRIQNETFREYQKFCSYRDMNNQNDPIRPRSIAKLSKDIGLSLNHLRKVSAKNKWVERSAKYDEYLEKIIREKNETDIVRMRKRHADIALKMLEKAESSLKTVKNKDIDASDIVRMVDVGVKIERLSRGESTENKQVSGETKITHQGKVDVDISADIDLANLSDEELEKLEQLLGKLHQQSDV